MISLARSLKTSLLLTSLNLDGAKLDQVNAQEKRNFFVFNKKRNQGCQRLHGVLAQFDWKARIVAASFSRQLLWIGFGASFQTVRRKIRMFLFFIDFRYAVASSNCLTKLDISQNKIDASFLSSQIIANSRTLQSLKISDCGITSELFVPILTAISTNTALQNFQLIASGNPIVRILQVFFFVKSYFFV